MEHPSSSTQNARWQVAAFGVGLGFIIASFILPGGGDLYEYYLPFAQGCNTCGYVPYFARWVLFPLAGMPESWSWTVLVAVSAGLFMWVARQNDINPLWLMMSMPMMSQLWGGQIDVFVVVGLLLVLRGKTPLVRSMGMALALIKPQLSFLALFFLFLSEEKQSRWQLLVMPALVLGLSLVVFGNQWITEWLSHALTLPPHLRRQASIDIWRFGIWLLPLPFLYRDRLQRLVVSLAVTAIATPFFSVYSYVIFLAFFAPFWSVILSYLWLAGWPILGESAIRLAWILPVGILAYFVYSLRKQ